MILSPFWSYFGSKHRIASFYPAPRYDAIVEPFAGAAGYALRHAHLKVLLYDTYDVVYGIWDYLIHVRESEVRSLPIGFAHLDEVQGIPQEARWLIGFWLARGRASPVNKPSSWMKRAVTHNLGADRKGFWGERMRARVANQLKHIRHWEVFHKSYESAPDLRCTWFIDPPYKISGKSYKQNSIDYPTLGKWCESRRGQVMVCEQRLDGVSPDWLPFRPFVVGDSAYNRQHTRKRKTEEVIWTRSDVAVGFGLERDA